jgi:hypothetical protein
VARYYHRRQPLINADPLAAQPAAITAVIVCYDEEPQQIHAAVDSLRGQTRPPSEIMIVDNGQRAPWPRLCAATPQRSWRSSRAVASATVAASTWQPHPQAVTTWSA